MQNFISRLLRFFLKLLLVGFGLVFALSLLAAALVMLLVGLVKWAVTGKRPGPVVAFSQFRQFKQFGAGEFKPFADQSDARRAPPADVVDVEVREVKPPVADENSGKLPP